MTPDDLRRLFPALARANDDLLGLLLRSVLEVELAAGDLVISSGTPNNTMFLIESGRVRVSLESSDECSILGDFGPGKWIGELGMIQPAPAVASVIALDDCTLLSLSHDEFMRLRRRSPALTSALLQMLCRDLSERLYTTIRFIDDEKIDGEEAAPNVPSQNLIEIAKNLLGIAARTGA